VTPGFATGVSTGITPGFATGLSTGIPPVVSPGAVHGFTHGVSHPYSNYNAAAVDFIPGYQPL
jgi:hypothetical protein